MIENGTGVALSRALSEAPIGTVIDTRTRSFLGRTRTQHKIAWGSKNFGSVGLPEWVDETDLIIVPDVHEPTVMARTFPAVVIEEIARDFESGEFDDVDATPDGIAQAIRDRYLRA